MCWVFCGQCDEEVPWDQYRQKAGLRQSVRSLNFLVAWGESRPQHEKLIIEISGERGLWLQLWVLACCLVAWPTFLFVSLTDRTRRHLMSHPYCSLALLSPYHPTGFFSVSVICGLLLRPVYCHVGGDPSWTPTHTCFPTPLKDKNKKQCLCHVFTTAKMWCWGNIGWSVTALVHSGIEAVTC